MSIDLQTLSNMLDLKKDVQILVTDQKYIAHSSTKVNSDNHGRNSPNFYEKNIILSDYPFNLIFCKKLFD